MSPSTSSCLVAVTCLVGALRSSASDVYAPWDYVLPQTWSQQYASCGGQQQSPVNLVPSKVMQTPYTNAALLYANMTATGGTGLSVLNTGRGLRVSGPFGYITLFGVQYNSVQIDVKVPSEHALNGQLMAAELQIMYQRQGSIGNSGLVIVSLLYQQGANDDPFLTMMGLPGLAPLMPQATMPIIGQLNVPLMLSTYLQNGFYHYQGSMTVPPCSEGVQWFVLQTLATVSSVQVTGFKSSATNVDPANNRPIQIFGGRKVVLSSQVGCSLEAGWSWGYLYPQCWSTLYPVCGGAQQSPVNIDPTTVSGTVGYAKLWSYQAYLPAAGLTVQSSGSGLYVNVPSGVLGGITINGATYNVIQLLLHFPSEHTLSGVSMAGELQIVHQKVGSTGNSDLLVLAVFIAQGSSDGSFLTQLGLPAGAPVGAADPPVAVTGTMNLKVSLAPSLISNFYYYMGSQTMPPCSETVSWFVLETPIPASFAQISAFNYRISGMPGNNRPLQLLNGRPVVMGGFDMVNWMTGLSDCPASGWNSYLPACWPLNYPSCGGQAQSPVNFVSAGPFQLVDVFDLSAAASYKSVSGKSVVNSGTSLAVTASSNDLGSLAIDGITYYVTGYSLQCPSSHTIDGNQLSCEMQIQHQQAFASGTNGLLIVSVLFIASAQSLDHPLLTQLGIPAGAPSIGAPGMSLASPVNLQAIFQSKAGPSGFYRYDGSLSQPPCTESVQRFVLSTPQSISTNQVIAYNAIFSGTPEPRPVQLMGGRGVFKNALPGCYSETAQTSWNYVLPQCWAKRYPACAGQRQSPINIDTTQLGPTGQKAILLDHGDASSSMVNTGNMLQVAYTTGGVQMAGVMYTTQSFSFHFDSEHAINGQLAAGELQIVHQKVGSTGLDGLLILSVLYRIGSPSPLLGRLGVPGSNLPKGPGDLAVGVPTIQLDAEIGQVIVGGYFYYSGSLTSPPCTESVSWIVLTGALTMSQQQVSILKALFPNPANNRPMQPLNGRTVVQNGAPTAVAGDSAGVRPDFGLVVLCFAALFVGIL